MIRFLDHDPLCKQGKGAHDPSDWSVICHA